MYRERLTITLEADLLAAIDSQIDKSLLRNRSQAIEHLLREGLGLHQLQQAFIFMEPNNLQISLPLLQKLSDYKILQLFLVMPSEQLDQLTRLTLQIHTVSPQFNISVVPADFGSGGAVMLKKDLLENPFLLCWPTQSYPLPTSMTALFLFHRQHNTLLTLTSYLQTDGNVPFCGLAIAQPDIKNHIPAGQVDLRADVFPALAKEGKVRAYVYQSS